LAVRLRTLGTVAVGVLVVLDIVLVTLAFRHVRPSSGASTPVAEARTSSPTPARATTRPPATPSRSPSPTATAKARPRRPAVPDLRASRTLVDIGAGAAVVRARTGTCGDGGATVELSLDGGETFVRSDVPSAAVILRAGSVDADNAWLVAMDVNCTSVTTYTTSNGGGAWSEVGGSGGNWHRLPQVGSRLHAPSGATTVPCARGEVVVGISNLDEDRAHVSCSDGVIFATADGGASWRERGTLPGVVDLDFVDDSRALAVRSDDEECEGVAVLATADGGASWTSRACVETDKDALPVVSADGDRAYLGVGDALWFSDDAGGSWQRRA
jgi:hypothetical protein